MKKIIWLTSLICTSAMAGGTIGGGGSGVMREDILNLVDAAVNIESLPKVYLAPDDFRRARARLSVAEVGSVSVLVDGYSVQVKNWRNSVVDVNISKEFLPESAK